MYYEQDEFFRLVEAIEAQDGVNLDETHDPVYHTKFAGDNQAVKGFEIVYCGFDTLFDVPYKPLDKFGNEAPDQNIKVCLVDDWMGRWPRFADAKAPGTDS